MTLSPTDVGLQLLQNSLVTGAVLVALILALQPVSAAFNPVVTLVEKALDALSWRQTGAVSGAQATGGAVGAVVVNLMVELPAVSVSAHTRSSPGLWFAEMSPRSAC